MNVRVIFYGKIIVVITNVITEMIFTFQLWAYRIHPKSSHKTNENFEIITRVMLLVFSSN